MKLSTVKTDDLVPIIEDLVPLGFYFSVTPAAKWAPGDWEDGVLMLRNDTGFRLDQRFRDTRAPKTWNNQHLPTKRQALVKMAKIVNMFNKHYVG